MYFSVNISDTNHSMEGSSSITMTVCLFVSNSRVYFSGSSCASSVRMLGEAVSYAVCGTSCPLGDSEGRLTVKVVSSPGMLSMFISPSSSVTMLLQMASPSPFLEFLPFISTESRIL